MTQVKSVLLGEFYKALNSKDPFMSFLQSIELNREGDVLCYLQYLSARHILVARAGKGMSSFDNLGLHLSQDKNFDLDKIRHPQSFELLKEFVSGALEREDYLASCVEVEGEPLGIVVLASKQVLEPGDFNMEWAQGIQLISSYGLLYRRVEKRDEYYPDTEILTPSGVHSFLQKEVIRARRLERPVSTVTFRVDHFEQHSQNMNSLQKKNWMLALGRLLKSQSRINDHVGRLKDGLFIVVLPHTSLEGAQTKATRLMEMVEESTLKVGGQSLKFSLSAVLNEYPRLSEGAEDLLSKSADLIETQVNEKSFLRAVGTREHFQVDFEVGES